jgi:hypothetical protein
MIDVILLFAFCLFMGLMALGVCAYLAISGQLFTLDGLVLALIALSIGGLFMLNVIWSIRTGELQQMLDHLRKKPASNEPSTNPS